MSLIQCTVRVQGINFEPIMLVEITERHPHLTDQPNYFLCYQFVVYLIL